MGCATSKSLVIPSNSNKKCNSLFPFNINESRIACHGLADLYGTSPSVGRGVTEEPPAAVVGSPSTWDDDPYASLEVVLTDQQKRIIVKNWRYLSGDLSGRGSRIFQLIFVRNPRVRSLFSCGHLHGDELVADERFRGHALRFMQAVGGVVDNLENYSEALAPSLTTSRTTQRRWHPR